MKRIFRMSDRPKRGLTIPARFLSSDSDNEGGKKYPKDAAAVRMKILQIRGAIGEPNSMTKQQMEGNNRHDLMMNKYIFIFLFVVLKYSHCVAKFF